MKLILKLSLPIFALLFITASCCAFFVGDSFSVASASDDFLGYIQATVNNEGLTFGNEFTSKSNLLIEPTRYNSSFYLDQSYYVKVIDKIPMSDNLYRVEFMGVKGYLNTAELGEISIVDVDFGEHQPYGNMPPLTFADDITEISVAGVTIDNTFTIRYLGQFDDNTISVLATNGNNSEYGHISKDKFAEFVNAPIKVPFHPITADIIASIAKPNTTTPDVDPFGTTTSKTVRIVLIIGIIIPALLIVFLLFKPSKGAEQSNYDKHIMKSKKKNSYDKTHNNEDYDRRDNRSPRRSDERNDNRSPRRSDDRYDERYPREGRNTRDDRDDGRRRSDDGYRDYPERDRYDD